MRDFGSISILLLLAVAGFVALSPALALAAVEKPSGTVDISTGSNVAGVWVDWGRGTLNFNDRQYGFKVNGLCGEKVGEINARSIGRVYNLNNVADFGGRYEPAAIGASMGVSNAAASLENRNGVVIELVPTSQGVCSIRHTPGVDIRLE
jgi:hypothetical protein